MLILQNDGLSGEDYCTNNNSLKLNVVSIIIKIKTCGNSYLNFVQHNNIIFVRCRLFIKKKKKNMSFIVIHM